MSFTPSFFESAKRSGFVQAFPTSSGDTLLMRELTHRFSNDLACAISAVSVAARNTEKPQVKSVLSELVEQLYRRSELLRAMQAPKRGGFVDAEAYLERLCLSLSRAGLDARNIGLVLSADPIVMEADRCWRLAMIVCELITNSARHAFHGRNEATILVELSERGGFAECRVTDDGSAPGVVLPGGGLRIVQELASSLGADFEQSFGPYGSVSSLHFPI